MTIDYESLAKSAVDVAVGVTSTLNPLAGIVMKWAGGVAFAIYDQVKAGNTDPVAAAELAGDKVADLVEQLKLGGT